jgi:hypothetical protein
VIRIDSRERRARLARRHRLAPVHWAAGPVDVARSLVALHSTDPASVHLACLARMAGAEVTDVERALYEERSLVRMLGMRRTVFVVPVEVAAVVQAGCTAAIAVRERAKLIKLLEQAKVAGPAQGAAWLAAVEAETLVALRARGQAVGQELSAAVPALRTQLSFGDESKKWAGVVAVSTRVLFLLAADGHIVRGRPRGSWISSQYRWVPSSDWLDEPWAPLDPEAARGQLAQRWLTAFGPARPSDLTWWTGWTAGTTTRTLASLSLLDVDLDGQPGVVLAGDEAPTPSPEPWAALLPALDPTVMGWAERDWFLGDAGYRASLFDRSGNVGPTVWWDGQVVGGWSQRGDGEIAVRLLRDIGGDGAAAVDEAAKRLRRSIGDVRITPRFRTPLERELSLS